MVVVKTRKHTNISEPQYVYCKYHKRRGGGKYCHHQSDHVWAIYNKEISLLPTNCSFPWIENHC